MEALTEDESLLGIKEAPSLIIPWWDASIPIHHSHGAGCHTRGGQGIQGEGQNLLQPFLGITAVKHKASTSQILCFSRLKYQEFNHHWLVKMGLQCPKMTMIENIRSVEIRLRLVAAVRQHLPLV